MSVVEEFGIPHSHPRDTSSGSPAPQQPATATPPITTPDSIIVPENPNGSGRRLEIRFADGKVTGGVLNGDGTTKFISDDTETITDPAKTGHDALQGKLTLATGQVTALFAALSGTNGAGDPAILKSLLRDGVLPASIIAAVPSSPPPQSPGEKSSQSPPPQSGQPPQKGQKTPVSGEGDAAMGPTVEADASRQRRLNELGSGGKPLETVLKGPNEKPLMEVHFAWDHSSLELTPENIAALDNIAAAYNASGNPNKKLVLTGFADASGPDVDPHGYNLKLSERRVNTLKQIMVDRYHIAADKIDTRAVGDTELEDPANTGRSQVNRRATADIAENGLAPGITPATTPAAAGVITPMAGVPVFRVYGRGGGEILYDKEHHRHMWRAEGRRDAEPLSPEMRRSFEDRGLHFAPDGRVTGEFRSTNGPPVSNGTVQSRPAEGGAVASRQPNGVPQRLDYKSQLGGTPATPPGEASHFVAPNVRMGRGGSHFGRGGHF